MDLIQEYREVEAKSREKYRGRMERQYKIVKPDATPEEIRYAMDTDQGSQVFSQAVRPIFLEIEKETKKEKIVLMAILCLISSLNRLGMQMHAMHIVKSKSVMRTSSVSLRL